MNVSKEKIEDYKKAISDIDIKSKTIENELQYLVNIGIKNREIEKGTVEYINDLIQTLLRLIIKLY